MSQITQVSQVFQISSVSVFQKDVLEGFQLPHKKLSPKYLYDRRGSELFDQICDCREYYVTRTETAILEKHATEMAEALGARPLVFEFGSGASRKTRILLDHLDDASAYVPIDISREFLIQSIRGLQKDYPSLRIVPMCADFTKPMFVPEFEFTHPVGRKIAFFPGSTIGNFDRDEARDFLRRTAQFLGPDGLLLIGVDLIKDKAILEPAYDDADGITAAFNLNLLTRIRSELSTDIDPSLFRHKAFFNEKEGRIEMHLESLFAQTIHIADQPIHFYRGETIHTECSYKYDPLKFEDMARQAGFAVKARWTDSNRYFGVFLLEVRRFSEQLPEVA